MTEFMSSQPEGAEPVRRRFVTREEFAAMSRDAPSIDLEAFRADQDAAVDQEAVGPYSR
jgi:hypothetical protein